MTRFWLRFSLCAALLAPAALAAQAPAALARDSAPRYALRPVPVPPPFRDAVARGTRTPGGAPGARYWQQRVRYSIEAELDPATATLRGAGRVVYHNASPAPLASLVLNLYQNVFSEGVPRNRYVPITGGITLERVAVQGETLRALDAREIPVVPAPPAGAPAGYAVQGTLARLVLPRPLASGDSLVLEVAWRFQVPPAPSFRTGWEDALGGRALQVAQWYPQIAVYDDVDGWDATPYLGDGEFYLEYGDFDVSLTLPAGWLVGATGTLQNPEQVLTETARRRLAQAARSDAVTPVVDAADLAAGRATLAPPGGRLTWRFRAEEVRDFAFAASDRYLWDATRARVPGAAGGEREVAVSAFHRPGAPHWEQAARYGQHAVAFLSRLLTPYLQPGMTIAEGPIGGMEYPGLVFIGRPRAAEALYSVIAHEAGGHQWFPMMVGSNEAAFAWMDEGFTTFYEELAYDDFYRTDSGYVGDLRSYLAVAGEPNEVPLMRHTDLVSPYGARTVAAYTKPGILLRALRSVLGEGVFDRAMRTYATEWRLKHPTPWDFFHTVERVAGRDLDWFFHPWWFETGVMDQEIEKVEVVGPDSVRVTVRDLGDNPMPARVAGITAAGDTVRAEIPVERWLAGARTATVTLRAPAPLTRVELDPERLFPDADRSNDAWTASGRR